MTDFLVMAVDVLAIIAGIVILFFWQKNRLRRNNAESIGVNKVASTNRAKSAWQSALTLSFGMFVIALIVSVRHDFGSSVVWFSFALCCLLHALNKLIFKDHINFRGVYLDFFKNPKSYRFYIACCIAIASLALNKAIDGLG